MIGDTADDDRLIRECLAGGTAQTNPEMSAVAVAEEIGRLLALRRTAKDAGDTEEVVRLDSDLDEHARLLDRIHARNRNAGEA